MNPMILRADRLVAMNPANEALTDGAALLSANPGIQVNQLASRQSFDALKRIQPTASASC